PRHWLRRRMHEPRLHRRENTDRSQNYPARGISPPASAGRLPGRRRRVAGVGAGRFGGSWSWLVLDQYGASVFQRLEIEPAQDPGEAGPLEGDVVDHHIAPVARIAYGGAQVNFIGIISPRVIEAHGDVQFVWTGTPGNRSVRQLLADFRGAVALHAQLPQARHARGGDFQRGVGP